MRCVLAKLRGLVPQRRAQHADRSNTDLPTRFLEQKI